MPSPRAAVKKPDAHASADRPFATMVGTLPRSAVVYRTRTPWQQVIDEMYANPGMWFEMSRTYSNVASALSSARKALEAEHPAEVVELLEAASISKGKGVRVFLRLRSHPGLEDPRPNEDEDEDEDRPPSLADALMNASEDEVHRAVAEPLPFQAG